MYYYVVCVDEILSI